MNPKARPSRVVVEPVRPMVDGGRWPAKATVDAPLRIIADVFTDGHDLVAAALLHRNVGGARPGPWIETPMTPLGNDRFEAWITPTELGRWEYDVIGWMARAESWRRGAVKKLDAGVADAVELEIGRRLVERILADPAPASTDDDRTRLEGLASRLSQGDSGDLHDESWEPVFHRSEPREPVARLPEPLPFDVDPRIAAVGAWYSFFPRSSVYATDEAGSSRLSSGVGAPPRHATLRDAIDRLDYIADLGFDVAYIPPIHPIGTTNRKGRDNTTTAEPDDVGSPYAIGSPDGGHLAVAPELGTVEDLRALVQACRDRGMELALDIAFNCSPDHPWVADHPEWFTTRPDGTIQYAENPPKKYEDIYPLDFESDDWWGLWQALAGVFRYWIDQGVRIFRVDNPHTKSFAFWEWALGDIRNEYPDTVFLSEAFTRPRVMQRLAKIGFNQSYTYFAWRHSAAELREYFTELASDTIDYLRPTAWPNTHDILTTQVQLGGRAGFVMRAVLAATLCPSWGIYGPVFELQETRPRLGVEDYADSEKYEVKSWDLDQRHSLAPLIRRLNAIRHQQPAFDRLDTIRFHETDNSSLLCFSKTDPSGEGDPVLVIVNCDPHHAQAGHVDVDLQALGIEYGATYDVADQLGGATYRWSANWNYVELSPWGSMAHVFTVREVS